MLNRTQSIVPIYCGLLWGDKLTLCSPPPLAAISGADKCAPCLPWRTATRIKIWRCIEEEERALIKCNIMTPTPPHPAFLHKKLHSTLNEPPTASTPCARSCVDKTRCGAKAVSIRYHRARCDRALQFGAAQSSGVQRN